jgi:hypothetical protein
MDVGVPVLELFWPTRRQNTFDEWCPAAVL